MPTQDGRLVSVTGKGGDVKINDTAKVVCSYTSKGAYIYMIDTVLTPPAAGTSTSTTPSTSSTETTSTSAAPSTSTEAPATSSAAPTDHQGARTPS